MWASGKDSRCSYVQASLKLRDLDTIPPQYLEQIKDLTTEFWWGFVESSATLHSTPQTHIPVELDQGLVQNYKL